MGEWIEISKASANNLKSISLKFPKYRLSVLSGPPGAGKRSLAIHSLAAESKSREEILFALNAGKIPPPQVKSSTVESVTGLPLVKVLDKVSNKSRHTVASFLNIDTKLWIKYEGKKLPCKKCGGTINQGHQKSAVSFINNNFQNQEIRISALAHHSDQPSTPDKIEVNLEKMARQGYSKAFVDTLEFDLEEQQLDLNKKTASIELVIDTLTVTKEDIDRLEESLELAFELGLEGASIYIKAVNKRFFLNGNRFCEECGFIPTNFRVENFDFRIDENLEPQGLSILSDTERKELLNSEMLKVSLETLLKSNIDKLNLKDLDTDSTFFNSIDLLMKAELGHLRLLNPLKTLSSGEAGRLSLVKAQQDQQSGILYFINEPSTGLHTSDISTYLKQVEMLCEKGNTVLCAENRPEFNCEASFQIELGPGAGPNGGSIVSTGEVQKTPLPEIKLNESALPTSYLKIANASSRNIKNIDVKLPVGQFSVVTGVSGAGKSTLLNDILEPYIKDGLANMPEDLGGTYLLSSTTQVPRTNVGSILKVLKPIQRLFAALPISKLRGYTEKYFSNHSPLRCAECKGSGRIENSVGTNVICPECNDSKFHPELLDVKYRGKSYAEIMQLSATEAREVLARVPSCDKILSRLEHVNLDYLCLGQPTSELSLGEVQLLRLASVTASKRRRSVFLFDEPCSSLSTKEASATINMIRSLTTQGNTVIAAEHNLDFISGADYILELGPSAGESGGKVVFQGPLADILTCKSSLTANAIKNRNLSAEQHR